jgi:hypothetical protein
MLFRITSTALAGSALALGLAAPTLAEELTIDVPVCVLPAPQLHDAVVPTERATVAEVEPNDTLGTAQVITPFPIPGDMTVNGDNFGEEQDFYSITLQKGDFFGVSCLATGSNPNDLDPQITIYEPSGTILMVNDDGYAGTPPSNPLPVAVLRTDSTAAFVATTDGAYKILVEPFTGGTPPQTSQGPYSLVMKRIRNPFESVPGTRQILFLDFNGASINAPALFGSGNNPANLSAMSTFLSNWGLTPAQESAVINAIIAEVETNLAALAFQNPDVDYDVQNSRDDPDPFGGANVSRVIIGGTSAQLGFSTIGIAESIDPGNFDASETAVVLLGDLSSTNPTSGISLNNVPRTGGASIIDVIGVAVGNLVCHEVGHYFGNWHTTSTNSTRNIMDQGPSTLTDYYLNIVETGPDLTFGNGDDNPVFFVKDTYAANEGIGAAPNSFEYTNFRTAYALSAAPSNPTGCTGDISNDGNVDGADLAILLAQWGPNPGSPADIDMNGIVDGADLAIFLTLWGPCPP